MNELLGDNNHVKVHVVTGYTPEQLSYTVNDYLTMAPRMDTTNTWALLDIKLDHIPADQEYGKGIEYVAVIICSVTPKVLENLDDKGVRFGIGVRDGQGGVGMTDGPFDNVKACLDIEGTKGSGIYMLTGHRLFAWDDTEETWVKI